MVVNDKSETAFCTDVTSLQLQTFKKSSKVVLHEHSQPE